jgi:hypothetical protein
MVRLGSGTYRRCIRIRRRADNAASPELNGVDVTSWHFWITYTGLALLLVVALPFSLMVMCGLALRRRSRGVPSTWAWRSSLTDVGMVHGTAPAVAMTLLPGSRAGLVPGRLSLVPLEDLLVMGWPGIVGNLLIFAALGFFVPMRFAALASLPRILALAGTCSVLIEVAQYVFALDRVSSVDDVLLNAAGAGLAALASRRWWRMRELSVPSGPGAAAALGVRDPDFLDGTPGGTAGSCARMSGRPDPR